MTATNRKNTRMISSRPRHLLVIPAAIAFAMIAGATAIAFKAPSRAPIVATVDLEKIFNGLAAQDQEAARIAKVAENFEAEIENLRAEVENLQAELENFEEGGDGWITTSRKVETAVSEYLAYEQYARVKIEAERSKSMRSLYAGIKEAVAAFSAEQSPPIDMVLIDDSIPEFEPADMAGTQKQISARRMLYVNNGFDITEAILAKMNASTGG